MGLPWERNGMEQLTGTEQMIYDYMRQATAENGYPPTIKEICAATGVKSTYTGHKIIRSLESKGWLTRGVAGSRAKSRGIVFTDRSFDPYIAGIDLPRTDFVMVPVMGVFADETGKERFKMGPLAGCPIPVLADKAKEGDFIVLVYGDEAKDAGIMDEDMVLVRNWRDWAASPPKGKSVAVVMEKDGFLVPVVFADWQAAKSRMDAYAYAGMDRFMRPIGTVEAVFRLSPNDNSDEMER